MTHQGFFLFAGGTPRHAASVHATDGPLLAAIRMQCDALDARPHSTDIAIVGLVFVLIAAVQITSRVRRGRRNR